MKHTPEQWQLGCQTRAGQIIQGEWTYEPHYLSFAKLGIRCFVVRNIHGFYLCGYIAVPEQHQWHGEGYDDLPAKAHGGLTYADYGKDHPVLPDDLYLVGFDCAHAGDLVPVVNALSAINRGATYRNFAYVKKQTENLAKQARRAWEKHQYGGKRA
jgi:hypothetical protein